MKPQIRKRKSRKKKSGQNSRRVILHASNSIERITTTRKRHTEMQTNKRIVTNNCKYIRIHRRTRWVRLKKPKTVCLSSNSIQQNWWGGKIKRKCTLLSKSVSRFHSILLFSREWASKWARIQCLFIPFVNKDLYAATRLNTKTNVYETTAALIHTKSKVQRLYYRHWLQFKCTAQHTHSQKQKHT